MVNKLLPFKANWACIRSGQSCFENRSRAKPKKSNAWNFLMIIRPITMLRLVAGTVLLLLVGLAEALAVEEIKKGQDRPLGNRSDLQREQI